MPCPPKGQRERNTILHSPALGEIERRRGMLLCLARIPVKRFAQRSSRFPHRGPFALVGRAPGRVQRLAGFHPGLLQTAGIGQNTRFLVKNQVSELGIPLGLGRLPLHSRLVTP